MHPYLNLLQGDPAVLIAFIAGAACSLLCLLVWLAFVV